MVYSHNLENAPRSGVGVANHTSPIDPLMLTIDNCYDVIGQRETGLLRLAQKVLCKASKYIWFERTERKDRSEVVKLMKDRINDTSLFPVLLFPEGVCVNNTSVLQFKKGVFEIATVVHPIAIRYDSRFSDPYWETKQVYMYFMGLMTSWSLVCDVWYLPPMTRLPEESGIEFANRVKAEIARVGGLVDLPWDGNIKHKPIKKEQVVLQQKEFARHIQQVDVLADHHHSQSQKMRNSVQVP